VDNSTRSQLEHVTSFPEHHRLQNEGINWGKLMTRFNFVLITIRSCVSTYVTQMTCHLQLLAQNRSW
jgi:lipoprotein signal peptidase